MKILYGVLSQGQGHINRAAALIERIRARGHEVQVFLAGNRPPAYTRAVLGDFQFVGLPNLVLRQGRLAVGATLRAYFAAVPKRHRIVRQLVRKLRAARIDLAITDFEPVSARAARKAGVPVHGVAGQYRITRTDSAYPNAPLDRLAALLVMNAWTPGLDSYFAVSFTPADATRPRTRVIGPLVGRDVRQMVPTRGGFYLAYLYSYTVDHVVQALSPFGPFHIYGLDREEIRGDLHFCRTGRDAFVHDLAACEGVILNGSFQGVCEATVLGKPILSIPFANQYEEMFNAHLIAKCNLGMAARHLEGKTIGSWIASIPTFDHGARPDGADDIIEELGL